MTEQTVYFPLFAEQSFFSQKAIESPRESNSPASEVSNGIPSKMCSLHNIDTNTGHSFFLYCED